MLLWWTLVVLTLVRTGVGQSVQGWWSNAVYYRILVDSFKDGDGDGLGDLKDLFMICLLDHTQLLTKVGEELGILQIPGDVPASGATKQLSYVRAIGADAVILSPISTRSSNCTTPGVVDFTEIDQRYGNLDAFTNLVDKAKKLELKVVMTLPLQSISTASEWFTSSADRARGFEDKIVWCEGSPDEPPPPATNIQWVWHETRQAFYASTNNGAILNLCAQSNVAAFSAAQCTWLRRGVSGIFLNPDFPSDVNCGEVLVKTLAAEAMSCVRAANLDTPVILVESTFPLEISSRYYADGGVGANSVLSGALTSSKRKSAADLGMAFYGALMSAPLDGGPTWTTSASIYESRVTTRYGNEMVDAINLLSLILPGAAVIQQGDELGTADTILEWVTSTTCWPMPATPAAAPFPWDDTTNAGFTSGDAWLPIAPNYRYANAKTEYANDLSHLGVVRLAAAMRKSPAIGPHVEIKRLNGALGVLRWGGTGSLLVVANLGRTQTEIQLNKIPGLPTEVTVAVSSAGSSFSAGSHIPVDRTLRLMPGEAILLVGGPRHCGGPGPVDKITSKLSEGWQKLNKYFSNM